MNHESTEKFKTVKLLLLDFDGVLTDGFVYVDQNGRETVRCSKRDSLGIAMLKRAGIDVGVISKEKNPVVSVRCKKLAIPCWQGIEDGEGKMEIVRRIALEKKLDVSEICYIGDDLNDIPALRIVGCAVTVADGHPEVKKVAHIVTAKAGGNHAVREVCDMILQEKNIPVRF